MFNISPMELMLVCVVALLVIGPDKLPGAIRTGSLWLGRFRRSYNKVKSEIERELNTDEIKRQLHNEAVLEEIEEAKAHVKKIADETKVSVDALVSSSSFDPGASSATESQAVRELEGEASSQAPGEENDSAPLTAPGLTTTKQPSYSTGVNPKLAPSEPVAETAQEAADSERQAATDDTPPAAPEQKK